MTSQPSFLGQQDHYVGIYQEPETRLWLARGKKSGRLVSVRVVSASDGYRPDRVSREAKILRDLHSDRIVKIVDYGQDTSRDEYYIFMEIVEGRPLDKFVAQQKLSRMEQFEALRLFRQILDALSVAHKKQVIHRNLRPSAIMITPEHSVKVWDFGLAAIVNEANPYELLISHAYMAPEIIARSEADERSDIYSAGAVFYFMLTGRPPFEAGDWITLAQKISLEPPVSLRWNRPDVIDEIEQLINKCMQKKPEERFSRVEEILRMLVSSKLNQYHDIKSYHVMKIVKLLAQHQFGQARKEATELRARYPNDPEVAKVARQADLSWQKRRRSEVERIYASAKQFINEKNYAAALTKKNELEGLLRDIEREGAEDEKYLRQWRDQISAIAGAISIARGSPFLVSIDSQKQYSLDTDKDVIELGRTTSEHQVDIDLSSEPKGRSVSRRHARLIRDGLEWRVQPYPTASNPTLIGGEKVAADGRVIEDGTVIQLGGVFLRFHIYHPQSLDSEQPVSESEP